MMHSPEKHKAAVRAWRKRNRLRSILHSMKGYARQTGNAELEALATMKLEDSWPIRCSVCEENYYRCQCRYRRISDARK